MLALFAILIPIALLGGLLFLLMPKAPPVEGTPRLQIPDGTVGKTIPVLFGSRVITDPSIVWWGDFAIVKVPAQDGGKK